MITDDEYSLTRDGERFKSKEELFENINKREPLSGEVFSCFHHCSIMKKSFLNTYEIK